MHDRGPCVAGRVCGKEGGMHGKGGAAVETATAGDGTGMHPRCD